ncbi:MAG: divergent PAP2 family protein [Gemmatimonadota bacterium]
MARLVALNPPLVLALLAMITVQLFKFASHWIRTGRIDVGRLTGTGGMPSSHAASVTALTTAIGLQAGWRSPLFGAVAFFALVVIYDAAGIRRAAGKQARVLNRIIDDLKAHHHVEGERLKELLGHTAMEALTGVAYGVVLTLALHP